MMQELADGKDPGELRFREGDFWSELGDCFNGIRAQVLEGRESRNGLATTQTYELTAAANTAD
jgi:hypothetical protein